MIEQFAYWGIIAFALWLFAVGAVMAVQPDWALFLLRQAASTLLIHCGELLIRGAFGLAMIAASKSALYPAVFMWIGSFIAASSVVILVLPRQWHAGYSLWWADHLPAWLVRVFSLIAFVAAAALIHGAGIWSCALNPICA
ncbi:hypothetical protein [Maricaulis sp.]|uniref:hypothetical protein n=1 Tax=Maricaulis sp. TaxID=1486257 RepID=UPI00260F503F|nr:hypothetical protein [Maricaulis sp.]